MVNPGERTTQADLDALASAASTAGVPGAPYYFRPRIHRFRDSTSANSLIKLPDVDVGHLAVNVQTLEIYRLTQFPVSEIGNWEVPPNWTVIADVGGRAALSPDPGDNLFQVADGSQQHHYVWRTAPAPNWYAYGGMLSEFNRLVETLMPVAFGANDYRFGLRSYPKSGPRVVLHPNTRNQFVDGRGNASGSFGPRFYSDVALLVPANQVAGKSIVTTISPEVSNYSDGTWYYGGWDYDGPTASLAGGMSILLRLTPHELSGDTHLIGEQQVTNNPRRLHIKLAGNVSAGEVKIGIRQTDGGPMLDGIWRESFAYGAPSMRLPDQGFAGAEDVPAFRSDSAVLRVSLDAEPSSYPMSGASSPSGVAAGNNTGSIAYMIEPAIPFLVEARGPPPKTASFNRGSSISSGAILAPNAGLQSPLNPDSPNDPVVSIGVDGIMPSYPVLPESAPPQFVTFYFWGVLHSVTVSRYPRLNASGIWVPDETAAEDMEVDFGCIRLGVFTPLFQAVIPAGQASVTVRPQTLIWENLGTRSIHYRSGSPVYATAAFAENGFTDVFLNWWLYPFKRPVMAMHYNDWLAAVEAY